MRELVISTLMDFRARATNFMHLLRAGAAEMPQAQVVLSGQRLGAGETVPGIPNEDLKASAVMPEDSSP